MPLSRSQDLRLYIGGDPVHGLTDAERTLRTLSPAAVHETYPVTAIGHAAAVNAPLRHRTVTLQASGWMEQHVGLRPAMDRVRNEDPPVTWTQEGGAAGTRSMISRAGVWGAVPTVSSDNEPVSLSGSCTLTDPADAICMAEGRFTGGGEQVLPPISQATRPVPIRTSGLRIQIISGQRQLLLYVTEGDANRYLMRGDYVQLLTGSNVSVISGTYHIDNIQQPSEGYRGVVLSSVPEVNQVWTEQQRNTVDGLTVLDTFNGDRSGLVHVSSLTRRDAETLRVALQGQAPGASTWQDIGTPQTFPIPTAAGADADLRQAFYFAIPADTRGVNSVRFNVQYHTSAGVPGARTDYSGYLRADFAPRVLHHD